MNQNWSFFSSKNQKIIQICQFDIADGFLYTKYNWRGCIISGLCFKHFKVLKFSCHARRTVHSKVPHIYNSFLVTHAIPYIQICLISVMVFLSRTLYRAFKCASYPYLFSCQARRTVHSNMFHIHNGFSVKHAVLCI